MGKTALYIAVILFSSLLLAIGWVDLSLGSRSAEPGPLGVAVQFSCRQSLAREHGLVPERMQGVRASLLEVRRHVQGVELEIGENQHHKAELAVCVTMNSGNRVVCRMPSLDWSSLDAVMARTIRRCVAEFMAYARTQDQPVQGLVLTI